MRSIQHTARRLLREEEAASAVEYAIVVAFVAAAISAAVSQYDLGNIFVTIVTKVQSIVSGV